MKFTVLPFLIALIAGIELTPGFHASYKANRRQTGFATIAPWLQRAADAIACAPSTWFASVVSFLRARPNMVVATLVLALSLAGSCEAVAMIGMAGTTVQQLETEYQAAREHALTMQSRNVDPATLQAAVTKAMSLKTKLENAKGNANMTAAIERVTGGMNGNGARRVAGNSWSAQFFSDESGYKWLQKTKDVRAGVFTSPAVELMSPGLMAATLSEDAASGGDLVIADFQPGILPLPTRPLTVADLFAASQTESNAITYMQEVTFTNASAAVAEGAAKPESTLAFDAVSDPVQKLAHWLPATSEILDDVAVIRSYIDTRLRHGLELTEEDQLLNGDGTAPNISGILDRAGLAADQARGADSNADAILKQITAIETATSMSPDGVILHPTNWQTIQLAKDAQGQYFGSGPFSSPQRPTLWGRPVAVTTAVTVNTAVVGCFKQAARIFRRGGVKIHVSNSHSDFFIKNLVAILAEERLALTVARPAAFGKVTGLN